MQVLPRQLDSESHLTGPWVNLQHLVDFFIRGRNSFVGLRGSQKEAHDFFGGLMGSPILTPPFSSVQVYIRPVSWEQGRQHSQQGEGSERSTSGCERSTNSITRRILAVRYSAVMHFLLVPRPPGSAPLPFLFFWLGGFSY